MNKIVFALFLLGLSACSNKFEVVKFDVNSAVRANETAKSFDEWSESESGPENTFARWRSQISKGEVSQQEICQALSELDIQKLTLFEGQIDDDQNADVIGECRASLQAKLESYFASQRATMMSNLDNFFNNDEGTPSEPSTPSAPNAPSTPNVPRKASASGASFRFSTIEHTIDTTNGFQATSKEDRRKAGLGPKEVVLTFDDGPSIYTPVILKTLAQVNAKATFFQVGKNVRIKKNSDLVKMVADGGHVLGGHTMSHANLKAVSRQTALSEIFGGLNATQSLLGWVYPVFRFPYGNSTPYLQQTLRSHHIAEFFWDVDSEDWKGRAPKQTIDFTMRQVRAKNGGVVLFHDIQKHTMELLPEFLRILNKEGYRIAILRPNSLIRSPISSSTQNKP